ncbi:hypothetical protein [Acidicapsa ligni]|uniref:hypothetical protein n=1 Tax=Acidicapsa ligni TaxID=542300 RepID=UPI0021E01863|nr:hypothetical protein [Acidicapsa ligni]
MHKFAVSLPSLRLFTLSFALLTSFPALCAPTAPTNCTPPRGYGQAACTEVTVGVQTWTYQRLYPLLSSLYNDLMNSTAALNPNAANGTSTDALIQSLQVQFGYSQLSATQNQAAAQMLSANTSFQSQLIQQQASLLQSSLAALQQQNQDQNTLTADTNAAKPSAVLTADQAALTAAQANVSTVAAQMAQVTAQLKAPTYAPAFASAAPVTALTNPTALSSSAGAPSSGTPAPNFPATKQIQNDVQYYWTRLLTLVGVMVKPDNADRDDQIYMLQFDTGIFPVKRKHQLLDVSYSLRCTDTGRPAPTVLDVFPRMAAVNITDTKYRDTQTGFGALISWLGFGLNASYNREHLRMSQVLGQSSYITGFGVGQSLFGWKYGISLGDDELSSDTRTTFALVSVPRGCVPHVDRQSTTWISSDGKEQKRQDDPPSQAELKAWANIPSSSMTAPTELVASIEFNRLEFDPSTVTAASPAVVSVILTLNKDIDQQLTVTANGTPIKRVRDTEGGATGTSTVTGVLESGTLGDNTWTPISARTLLLNLDGTLFGARFPEIILAAPTVTDDLTGQVAASQTCPAILVSGKTLLGGANCLNHLPSLAYKKSTTRTVTAARILQGLADGKPRIMFTVLSPNNPLAASASTSSSSIQVASDATSSEWGGATEVYQTSDASSQNMTRLDCDRPQGSKLLCSMPATQGTVDISSGAKYQILDLNHQLDSSTTGPLSAWASLDPCYDAKANDTRPDTCKIPTYWNIIGPQPVSNGSGWDLKFEFVNVDTSNTFQPKTATLGSQALSFDSNGETQPVALDFAITPASLAALQDDMTLVLSGALVNQSVRITNLWSKLAPTTNAQTDLTNWTGSNLISAYNSVQIGLNGPLHKIVCTRNVYCQLDPSETDAMKNETKSGLIYLVAHSTIPNAKDSLPVPLMLNGSGAMSIATYTPPPKPGATGPSGTPGAPGSAPITNPQPTVPPSNNLGPAPPNNSKVDVIGTQTLQAPPQ